MMAKLTSVLDNKGFRVFSVPEAATMLNKGGVQIDASKMTWDAAVRNQALLMQMQMALEDTFVEFALNEQRMTQKPALILCDRGILDGSAYIQEEMWHQVLDENDIVPQNFISKRYDAVLHMVTAAQGAEEFYNYSNEARFENPEQARKRDEFLRQAYMGHRKYMIVDNESSNFEEKIKRSISMISSVLGLPTDVAVFRKYLVSSSVPANEIQFPPEITTDKTKIRETYLNVP